jgi:hypothetical protein
MTLVKARHEREHKRKARVRRKGACHCMKCCGQIVDMRTVKAHAEKHVHLQRQFTLLEDPSGEVQSLDQQPAHSLQPSGVDHHAREQSSVRVLHVDQPRVTKLSTADRDMLDAYDNFFLLECPNIDTPLESLQTEDDGTRTPVTVGMLIMMHVEWMDTFNDSLNSAAHQWNTIRALVSVYDSKSLGLFDRIERFVDKYRLMTARKIDMCPCTQTIYFDLQDPKLRRKYPHIRNTGQHACDKCGLSRHTEFRGTTVPRKVFWYLPYRSVL